MVFWVIVVVLHSCFGFAVSDIELSCVVLDTVLDSGDNCTLRDSCGTVMYNNVTFANSTTLNISLSRVANADVAELVITFVSCQLESGASIIIDASSASVMGRLLSISVAIVNLTGFDGGILFVGSFPRRSSLLISGANMKQMGGGPTFAFLDQWRQSFGKSIMLFHINLVDYSSLIIADSTFTGGNGSNLVYINAMCIYSTGGISLDGHSSLLIINSSMTVVNRTSDGIFFNHGIFVIGSPTKILRHSVWIVSGFHAAVTGVAYLMHNSSTLVDEFSTWLVTNCVLDSTFVAAFTVRWSLMIVRHVSAWIFVGNTFRVTSGYHGGFDFILNTTVTIDQSGWLAIIENNISFYPNGSLCIRVLSPMSVFIVRSSGYVSLLGNNCSAIGRADGPPIELWGGSFLVENNNMSGGMFQRCNRIDNVPSTAGLPSGYANTSSIGDDACTMKSNMPCDASAECFAPLTILDSPIACTASPSGAIACRCLRGGSSPRCWPEYPSQPTRSMSQSFSNSLLLPTTRSEVTASLLTARQSASFSTSQSPTVDSRSITATSSCPPVEAIVLTERAFLSITEFNATVIEQKGSVDMGLLLAAGHVQVQFISAPLIFVTSASNESSSFGEAVDVLIWGGGVIVNVATAQIDPSTITAADSTHFVVSVIVALRGPCLRGGFLSTFVFQCELLPRKTLQGPLQTAVQTTFQTAVTATSVLGNPVSAMTTTSMISLMELTECVFSDVDPVDANISPTGVGVGDPVGQYFRGAVVAGLLIYVGSVAVALGIAMVLIQTNAATNLVEALAMLRFPSLAMVPVCLIHQGLVSSGVSIARVNSSPGDVGLGVLTTATSAAVVCAIAYVTTFGFPCQLTKRENVLRKTNSPFANRLLQFALWDHKWVDRTKGTFKRRYFLMFDGMRLPWWTAVELLSGLVQGAVLGIRANSVTTCRAQLLCLVVLCAIMFIFAAYTRPCGPVLDNIFLILLKLGALQVALLALLHVTTLEKSFSVAAGYTTAIATFVASVQTAYQVLLLSLLLLTSTGAHRKAIRFLRASAACIGVRMQTGEEADQSSVVTVVHPPLLGDDVNDHEMMSLARSFNASICGSSAALLHSETPDPRLSVSLTDDEDQASDVQGRARAREKLVEELQIGYEPPCWL